MAHDPEELSPSTRALVEAMLGSMPSSPEAPALEPAPWVAYAMKASSPEERAALERRAAQDHTSRHLMWEVFDRVEEFQRLPLAEIDRDPVGEAYVQLLTRPVRPAAKGLVDWIREGGDAARLAWTTLEIALKNAATPAFSPVFRSGGPSLLIEGSSQTAEARIEEDAIQIALDAPEGERLFVSLELGEHRLSLGIAEAEEDYRLAIDPSVLGRHRLVARWDEWPTGSDAPLVQIEGGSDLSLAGIPEIVGGVLRIPIAWEGDENGAVGVFCAFAPGFWQYLGQRYLHSKRARIEIEYPGPAGAFPWPLRLTVQGPE